MAEFHFVAHDDEIQSVQTVQDTRRQRLEMLITRFGSQANLNEALGFARNDSKISQIKNQSPHSKTGVPRQMGDDMAREIEAALSLPKGWMDTPPTYVELLGEDDPRSKMHVLMEQIPESQWPMAIRLLDALAQQPTESTGTHG